MRMKISKKKWWNRLGHLEHFLLSLMAGMCGDKYNAFTFQEQSSQMRAELE